MFTNYSMALSGKFSCSFTAHEGRGAILQGLELLVFLADQAEALELLLAGIKYGYKRRLGALKGIIRDSSLGISHAKRESRCRLPIKVVCGGIAAINDPMAAQRALLAPSTISGCPGKSPESRQDRHNWNTTSSHPQPAVEPRQFPPPRHHSHCDTHGTTGISLRSVKYFFICILFYGNKYVGVF